MDRTLFAKLYRDFWTDGLWAAPWSKALADLTPQQAVFKPAAGRKSIWQIVSHTCFWRDYHLDRLTTGAKLSNEEIAKAQHAEPTDPSPALLAQLREKLQASHHRMVAAIEDERLPLEKLVPVLAHDAYHLGQIMYIRALLGFAPID